MKFQFHFDAFPRRSLLIREETKIIISASKVNAQSYFKYAERANTLYTWKCIRKGLKLSLGANEIFMGIIEIPVSQI